MLFGTGVASANAGSLNASFGNGGNVVNQYGLGTAPQTDGGGVAVAPNGDIYQAGSVTTATGARELYLARYQPNGAPDTSFGQNGVVYENVGAGSSASTANVVGPFGARVYVSLSAGGEPIVATDATTSSGGLETVVLEFTQSGGLDSAFGSGGVYASNVGGVSSTPGGMAVESNGEIVLTGSFQTGSGYQELFAERLTSAGALDTGFASGGYFEQQPSGATSSGGTGVVAQSNGDVVLGGVASSSSSTLSTLTRLTSSGQLDASFGNGGTASVDTSSITAMLETPIVVTPDGGYVIAGGVMPSGSSSPQASVTRFTSTGELDTAFGSGGTSVVPTSLMQAGFGTGLILEADGRLLLSGIGVNSSGMGTTGGPFVARLNADGTLDTSFANGGVSLNALPGTGLGFPVGAAETADGNLVLGGTVAGSAQPEAFIQEVNLDTAPSVSFAYAPTSVQAGVPVQFSAAAEANDGYSIGQVSWDFGGGSFGDATGSSVSHTFTTPGIYTVRVQATDSFGLSTISTQTITVTAAPAVAPVAVVTPQIRKAPKLRLISIREVHGRIKVKLACAGASCHVSERLTTLEHLISGRTASLSPGGHGKHTRTVSVGAARLTLGAGRTRTFTLRLNRAGRKLLASFHRIPATASFRLTNGKPKRTLRRRIRVH